MGGIVGKWPILFLLVFLIAGCASHPVVKNMVLFDREDMARYLNDQGFKVDEIDNYWEDAKGRVVYIPSGDAVSGYELIILTADREHPYRISLPNVSPVREYWADPAGRLLNLPHFAYDDLDHYIYTEIDFQSGYFFQRTPDHIVHIGNINDPNGWLFSVPDSPAFMVCEIHARGKTVYLLDDRDCLNYPFISVWKNNCRSYAPDPKDASKYIESSEFRLNGTFDLGLTDPFSDLLVCYRYAEIPFASNTFLFDTRIHKRIADLPDDKMILFLQSNWLGPRLGQRPTSTEKK